MGNRGLVLRAVRADRGVVGLLRLPRDDPVLDVDLPGAGARAVDAVGRADDLVVAPAVPVEDVAGATTLAEHRATVVGLLPPGEEPSGPEERRRGRAVDAPAAACIAGTGGGAHRRSHGRHGVWSRKRTDPPNRRRHSSKRSVAAQSRPCAVVPRGPRTGPNATGVGSFRRDKRAPRRRVSRCEGRRRRPDRYPPNQRNGECVHDIESDVLSSPTRQAIMELLHEAGSIPDGSSRDDTVERGLSASDTAAALGLHVTTARFHLERMLAAGAVVTASGGGPSGGHARSTSPPCRNGPRSRVRRPCTPSPSC